MHETSHSHGASTSNRDSFTAFWTVWMILQRHWGKSRRNELVQEVLKYLILLLSDISLSCRLSYDRYQILKRLLGEYFLMVRNIIISKMFKTVCFLKYKKIISFKAYAIIVSYITRTYSFVTSSDIEWKVYKRKLDILYLIWNVETKES